MRAWSLLCVAACAPASPVDRPNPPGTVDSALDSGLPADTDRAVDTDLPAFVVRVEAGAPILCADPSARDTLGPFEAWVPSGFGPDDQDWRADDRAFFAGGAVAILDIDGDGALDLARGTDGRGLHLYLRRGDGFVREDDRLPGGVPASIGGVVPVDIDADGVMDLFVAGWEAPDALLRNDGSGQFTDIAPALGLAGPADARSIGASFADADGDGDVDVAVAVHGDVPAVGALPFGQPSRVLLRQPDGTFADLVPAVDPTDALHRAHAFLLTWVDLDGTPPLELYGTHDFGWRFPNAAYALRDGTIVPLRGLGIEATGTNMGLGLGDLDDDGVPDLAVPAIDVVFLYRSEAGTWFDVAAAAGVVPASDARQRFGWGAELVDLDHDGDLDLPVVFGFLDQRAQSGPNPGAQPDALWVAEDGVYRDRAAAWGLDQSAVGRGLVAADVDGDGWIDLVKANLAGPSTVHRGRCGDAAWLGVRLRDLTAGNRDGLGARVAVEAGGVTRTRWVLAGGTGYGGGAVPEVLFGLGDADAVDALVVTWPDGTVDRLPGPALRQRVTVVREAAVRTGG